MSEELGKPNFSVSGSATLKSTARGSDTGLIVVTIAGVALFTVGSGMYTASPAWLSALGACVGLVLTAIGAIGWYLARTNKDMSQAHDTIITLGDDHTSIVASPVLSTRDMLRLLRVAAQHRRPLPAPHGFVVGNPQDASAVKPYSDTERQVASEAIRAQELQHDASIKELVIKVRAGLPAAPASSPESDPPDEGASLTQR